MNKISVIDFLEEELNRRFSTKRTFRNAAAVFTQPDDSDWWFEAPTNKQSVYLHAGFIGESDMRFLQKDKLEDFLCLNCNQEFMKNSWIGMHKNSNTMRVFQSCASNALSPQQLIKMIKNIDHLREKLSGETNQERYNPMRTLQDAIYTLG